VELNGVIALIQFPAIDPVALRIGPIAVRWYGIAYLLGFTIGYAMLNSRVRRGLLPIGRSGLQDLVGWIAIGVMVGGRLGWWLFYHRASGAPEPWYEPIALWHGGMSFHGGLIGVIAALLTWSWWNQISFWSLADNIALVAPVGLFFGRLANFINAELVGRPTTLPWGMLFPGEPLPRHPSQIYEALVEGPALLLLLCLIARARPRAGRVAGAFLVLYGVFRFALEFTRQPDDQLGFVAFGWLTMGQLLSAVAASVGMIALFFATWSASGASDRSGPDDQSSSNTVSHPLEGVEGV
jgi:phosphatidylglycerol:prolipoprotein diacylglycerol transferase